MIYNTLHFLQAFAAVATGFLCGIALLTDAEIKRKSGREFFFFALFSVLLGGSIYLNAFSELGFIPRVDIEIWKSVFFMAAFAALMAFGLHALGATTGNMLFITSLNILSSICGMLLFREMSIVIPFIVTGFPASVIAMCGLRKMGEDATDNLHRLYLTLCSALGVYMLMFTLLLLGRMPDFPGSETLAACAVYIRIIACVSLMIECYIFYSSFSHSSGRSFIRYAYFVLSAIFIASLFMHYTVRLTYYGDKLALDESASKMREVSGTFNSRIARAVSLATLFTEYDKISTYLASGDKDGENIAVVQALFERYKNYLPYVSVYMLDNEGVCVASGEKVALGASCVNLIPEKEFERCVRIGQTVFAARGAFNSEPGVYAARRIDSPSGGMGGMIIVKLSSEYFIEAFPEDFFFLFFSSGGEVLMSSERNLSGALLKRVTQKSITASWPDGGRVEYGGKSKRLSGYLFLRGTLTPSFGHFTETWHFITGERGAIPTGAYAFGINLAFLAGFIFLLMYGSYKVFYSTRILSLTSESRKKAYFTDSMAGVILIDESFTMHEINARALFILGRQRIELLGRPFSELAPPSRSAESARFSERLEKLFKDGSANAGVCYFEKKHHSGGMPCLYSLTLITQAYSRQSTKRFAALVFMDISDLAERIRSLEIGEKQMRSLMEAVRTHIFMLNTKGEFISSNDSAIVQAMEKGVKMRLNDFFPVETAVLFKTMLDNINVMKNPITFEHIQDVCGTERIFADTLFPIINGGRVVSVGGVVMDITQTRRTENALAETKQKLNAVAGIGDIAVWETDEKGVLTFCRHSFTVGKIPVGVNPLDYFAPSDAERIRSASLKAIKSSSPFKLYSCEFKFPSGMSFSLIVGGEPFYRADGAFAGFRGFALAMPESTAEK